MINDVDMLTLATTNVTAHDLRQRSVPQWSPSTHVGEGLKLLEPGIGCGTTRTPSNDITNHERCAPAQFQGDSQTQIQTSIARTPTHPTIHPSNDTQFQTPRVRLQPTKANPNAGSSAKQNVHWPKAKPQKVPNLSALLLLPFHSHRLDPHIRLMVRMFRISFCRHTQSQPHSPLTRRLTA